MADSISGQTFQSKLIGAFAGVALVLASFGLYGVLAFNVGRRTREIGIRMALGAPRVAVAGNVFLRGFAMVIPGLAMGCFGAWLVGRSLASQGSSRFQPTTRAHMRLRCCRCCWPRCWRAGCQRGAR